MSAREKVARAIADAAVGMSDIWPSAVSVPCGWCTGTGSAPEEVFGRDEDGAPMVDGDQPCPEGCSTPSGEEPK